MIDDIDGYLRALFEQGAEEGAVLDRSRQAQGLASDGVAQAQSSSPGVSMMITNRQRAELRERGLSDEAIRLMTPAEAHAQLDIPKSNF
ncbi:hypothetical protein [Methylobacterium iners]|uniref:Uncharacterized protein n=1 Tax=Methylobacterium iners TaxID=418707 RepID=A0ABQ4RZ05_9HYPH|nr:hypothetical protein [Methylobacterium iners]GJD96054.1 hypothetical protein OCOJLMKI_3272 [Methylobacterium iners]